MEKIYLVELNQGCYEDRSSRILKAFALKKDAEEYAEKCRDLAWQIRQHNHEMSHNCLNFWVSFLYIGCGGEINSINVIEVDLK